MNQKLKAKYDMEAALRNHLPAFFEVLDGNSLNWGKINRRMEEVLEERKLRLGLKGNPIKVEFALMDVIVQAFAKKQRAISFLSFIQKVFEELAMRLDKMEKKLITPNLYGLLTNVDLKYLNFLGELLVLNQMKKNRNYKLLDTEVAHDPGKKDGAKIDFKFYVPGTGKEQLVEIINIHIDENKSWDHAQAERALTERIRPKLRAKGMQMNANFYLVPVLWGSYETIKVFIDYYKEKSPVFQNTILPSCFLAYYDEDGGVVHRFGAIDSVLL